MIKINPFNKREFIQHKKMEYTHKLRDTVNALCGSSTFTFLSQNCPLFEKIVSIVFERASKRDYKAELNKIKDPQLLEMPSSDPLTPEQISTEDSALPPPFSTLPPEILLQVFEPVLTDLGLFPSEGTYSIVSGLPPGFNDFNVCKLVCKSFNGFINRATQQFPDSENLLNRAYHMKYWKNFDFIINHSNNVENHKKAKSLLSTMPKRVQSTASKEFCRLLLEKESASTDLHTLCTQAIKNCHYAAMNGSPRLKTKEIVA